MFTGELLEALLGIGGGVEGVDLGRGRGVFVGDGAVGDAGVGERHPEAAMAEHGGDRFESHPTVDRLGRQRVTQLVRCTRPSPAAVPTRRTQRAT